MTEGIVRDIASYSEQDQPMNRWQLIIGGETVSTLWVAIETGEIMQVETPTRHQRNGYAGRLYRAAAAEIDIFHAPAAHRTPEGDAFAHRVGGPEMACAHGCCDDTPLFDDED